VIGLTGMLDYVEFNSEDAQFDLPGLDNFCRAAELRDLTAMIRVDQGPRRFLVQPRDRGRVSGGRLRRCALGP
jgi:hypothetical protein